MQRSSNVHYLVIPMQGISRNVASYYDSSYPSRLQLRGYGVSPILGLRQWGHTLQCLSLLLPYKSMTTMGEHMCSVPAVLTKQLVQMCQDNGAPGKMTLQMSYSIF